MNTRIKWLATSTVGLVLFVVAESPDAPHAPTFVGSAHAFIGMPLTPLSVAGVARRTTRRVVAVEGVAVVGAESAAMAQQSAMAQQQAAAAQQQAAAAQKQAAAAAAHPPMGTVVTSLPAGCVAQAQGGIEYQNCGGVKYRAAFQGNNLVYVSQ